MGQGDKREQLSSFFDEARITQEARFQELRNSILEEFSRDGSTANKEAFKDPDFQYSIQAAHDSYARAGSVDALEELVKLIVERSKRPAGTRASRVLASAIEIAAQISADEYACLACTFYMQNTVVNLPAEDFIINSIVKTLEPFLQELINGQMVIDYLSSRGCLIINQFSNKKFSSILDNKYGHAFGEGMSLEELNAAYGNGFYLSKIQPRLVKKAYRQDRYFFTLGVETDLRTTLISDGIEPERCDNLVGLMAQRKAEPGVVYRRLESMWPDAAKVRHYWDSQGIERVTLTLLGKSLAHSILKGRANFDAPLEIWVN